MIVWQILFDKPTSNKHIKPSSPSIQCEQCAFIHVKWIICYLMGRQPFFMGFFTLTSPHWKALPYIKVFDLLHIQLYSKIQSLPLIHPQYKELWAATVQRQIQSYVSALVSWLKWLIIPSSSLKSPKYIKMKILFISIDKLLDTSPFSVCVCIGCFRVPPPTCGFRTTCDVNNYAAK